jgi:hypothetical protein
MIKVARASLIIITVAVAIRIALPYILLTYAQHHLAKVPDYQIKLNDVSLRLYQGEIIFSELSVEQLNPPVASPILTIKNFSINVSWLSLLHGVLIIKTHIDSPFIKIFLPPKASSRKAPPPDVIEQWKTIITAISPFPLKNIFIRNGELRFAQLEGSPSNDWIIKNIELHLSNEKSIVSTENPLPSSLTLQANTMDGVPIAIKVYFNPLAQLPTFKINAIVTDMQIKPLNPLLHYYTKVEVNAGTFNFFLEAAAKDGKLVGYVKPLIKNLKIKSPDKEAPLSEKIYKQAAQLATKILKNSETQMSGAKIKVQGNINKPDTSIWPIIGSLLKNAFIQSLLPQLDNSITLKSIEIEK